MERYTGIIGIILILLIALLMSDNRKKISIKTVSVGLGLQIALAIFVLKIPIGQKIFEIVGLFIEKLLCIKFCKSISFGIANCLSVFI